MLQTLVQCKACPSLKLGILMESSVCRKPQQIFIFGSLQELEVTSRIRTWIMHFVKHRKISPGVTPPSDCCQRSASWESMIYHQAYQLHPCHHVAQGIPIWYMLKPQLGDLTCNFPPPQRNNTRGCDFGISIAILNHTTAFLSVFMTENPVAVTVSLETHGTSIVKETVSPGRPYQGYVHHSRPQYLHHQSPFDWRCSWVAVLGLLKSYQRQGGHMQLVCSKYVHYNFR